MKIKEKYKLDETDEGARTLAWVAFHSFKNRILQSYNNYINEFQAICDEIQLLLAPRRSYIIIKEILRNKNENIIATNFHHKENKFEIEKNIDEIKLPIKKFKKYKIAKNIHLYIHVIEIKYKNINSFYPSEILIEQFFKIYNYYKRNAKKRRNNEYLSTEREAEKETRTLQSIEDLEQELLKFLPDNILDLDVWTLQFKKLLLNNNSESGFLYCRTKTKLDRLFLRTSEIKKSLDRNCNSIMSNLLKNKKFDFIDIKRIEHYFINKKYDELLEYVKKICNKWWDEKEENYWFQPTSNPGFIHLTKNRGIQFLPDFRESELIKLRPKHKALKIIKTEMLFGPKDAWMPRNGAIEIPIFLFNRYWGTILIFFNIEEILDRLNLGSSKYSEDISYIFRNICNIVYARASERLSLNTLLDYLNAIEDEFSKSLLQKEYIIGDILIKDLIKITEIRNYSFPFIPPFTFIIDNKPIENNFVLDEIEEKSLILSSIKNEVINKALHIENIFSEDRFIKIKHYSGKFIPILIHEGSVNGLINSPSVIMIVFIRNEPNDINNSPLINIVIRIANTIRIYINTLLHQKEREIYIKRQILDFIIHEIKNRTSQLIVAKSLESVRAYAKTIRYFLEPTLYIGSRGAMNAKWEEIKEIIEDYFIALRNDSDRAWIFNGRLNADINPDIDVDKRIGLALLILIHNAKKHHTKRAKLLGKELKGNVGVEINISPLTKNNYNLECRSWYTNINPNIIKNFLEKEDEESISGLVILKEIIKDLNPIQKLSSIKVNGNEVKPSIWEIIISYTGPLTIIWEDL